MKTYHLKLTTLSPIHIGTGQDYEPTNYVIDKANMKTPDGQLKEFKMLFEFDEIDFYKSLDTNDKKELERLASDSSAYARFKIYKFIHTQRKRVQIAKSIAFKKIVVTDDVYNKYQDDIGESVQNEGRKGRVFDQFTIARAYTVPNSYRYVVPGSSIKGSISTAYQEHLYNRGGKNYDNVKKLMLTPNNENLFKNFSISDANTSSKTSGAIATIVNVKRNIERTGISNRLEVIRFNTKFNATVTVKEPLKFDEVVRSCNEHYMPIFHSMFNNKTDSNTLKEINADFIQKYKDWQPQNNQFLLRIGHHSGGRATSIDGMREIKVKTQRGYESRKEETTVWLYRGNNNKSLPLGWALCEYTEATSGKNTEDIS
jgi:CRISPR-associated protein Csm5